jgi:hypothetical protein
LENRKWKFEIEKKRAQRRRKKSDEIVDGRAGRALPVGVKLFADEACVVSPLLSL